MLPNGNLSRSNAVPTVIENTTAFDTISYIIFCYASDNEDFKKQYEAAISSVMQNFMAEYLKSGATRLTKKNRDLVLSSIFPVQDVNGVKIMNCRSTPLEMLGKFWTCTCNPTLEIELSSKSYFDVDETCDTNHDLVFIDTKDSMMRHSSIPQAILINEKVFSLHSIVERIDYNPEKSHYYIDIKRKNSQWYRMDNTSIELSKFSSQKEKKIHLLSFSCATTEHTKDVDVNVNMNSALEMIQNFHTFSMTGTKIKVENCCGADSIFHCLVNIYEQKREIFRKYTSADPLIMNILEGFSKKDARALYSSRIKFLLSKGFEIKPVSSDTFVLNAQSNIISCLEMLFSKRFPSAIATKICGCGEQLRDLSTIAINMVNLIEAGIAQLDTCFLFNNNTQAICSKCKQNKEIKMAYAPIAFIDIQPLTSKRHKLTMPSLILTEIPKNIKLGDRLYQLHSVIEFKGANHYTAHCVEDGSFWEYDDTCLIKAKSKQVNRNIHLLVYIR